MQPNNIQEYLARFARNNRIEGFGIDGTRVVGACPFCAASDWMTYRVYEAREAMEKGAVCKECHRGARAVFTDAPNEIRFEVVQTTGPDQPEWLTPKMRRVG